MQTYVGVLRWDYGEMRPDESWENKLYLATHNEEVRVDADSSRTAFNSVRELARQKINSSTLPGRPGLDDIMLRLLELRPVDGKPINLGRGEMTFVRPVFPPSFA